VAVDALSVISIDSFDRLRPFDFPCIMAFEATFRYGFLIGFHGVADVAGDQCRLIFRWMVVAIVTGNTVTGVGSPDEFSGAGVWTTCWHGVAPTAWLYHALHAGPFLPPPRWIYLPLALKTDRP